MLHKPTHMVRGEKKGLEQRLTSLMSQASMEFQKIATDLGLKTTEGEAQELFRFYSEQDQTLNFAKFVVESSAILSPRRRAIERVLKRYDINGTGRVAVKDLVDDQYQRPGEPFLVKTTEKIVDVRRRLMNKMRQLPATSPYSEPASSSMHTPRSSRKAMSEFSEDFDQFAAHGGLAPRSSEPNGLDAFNELPRYEYLHLLSRRRLESTFEMRRRLDEKEMEHCTFKPLINTTERKGERQAISVGERLYATAKEKAAEKGPSIPTWELRELEQCTFHPKINKNSPVFSGNRKTAGKPSRQAKEREQPDKGAKWATAHDLQPDGRSGVHALGPGGEDTERTTPMSPTFRTDQRQRDRTHPLLYVDINVGLGKVGRIGLHEGDDPAVLAQNFCLTYSLGDATKLKLVAFLTEQLAML